MKIIVYSILAILITTPVCANEVEFIWAENYPDGSKIYLSEYHQGEWQAKRLIAEDENLNFLPALGSDSNQRRLAVWVRVDPSGNSVLKYSFERGGEWQAPQTLSDMFKTNLSPVIVFDSQDRAWIFWSANDDDDDEIYAICQTGDHWTEPVKINNENDVPDILPQAGLDESGNVWVSWLQFQEDSMVYRRVAKKRIGDKWVGFPESESKHNITMSEFDLPEPPPFFRGDSRATFHFPNDKQNQSATMMKVE